MNTHDIEPLQDAADLLRLYLKLCKSLPRGGSCHHGRIERSIAAIEADRKCRGEPVAPEGFRLIAVNETFDSLTFWLDRCEQKGHLENCADLVEPWEAFEYREVEAPQPQQQVSADSALKFAAQVVELYDDATMRDDHMIDSGDCAGILNALADYFTKTAPQPAELVNTDSAGYTLGPISDGGMDPRNANDRQAKITPADLDLAAEIWAAAQKAPGEGIEDAEDRIAAILAGSRQARGEPVAWISDSPTKGNGRRLFWTKTDAWRWSSNVKPLYTAPQPTTEEPLKRRRIDDVVRGLQASVAVGSDGEWVSIRREARDAAIDRIQELNSDCAHMYESYVEAAARTAPQSTTEKL